MYNKFKDLCDKKGVTAYKVAKDLGFSSTSLYEWKSGKTKPKLDKISKIALYFGVDIAYFVGD